MGDTDTNETVDTPQPPPAVTARPWTTIPFFVLGAGWLGFTGPLTYLLWTTAPGAPVASPYYGIFILGGTVLTLLGFMTGLTVWLLARARAGEDEVGVGRTIWWRAVGTTAAGVALWWIALLVLDMHRAGLLDPIRFR